MIISLSKNKHLYLKKYDTYQSIINNKKTIEIRLNSPFFKNEFDFSKYNEIILYLHYKTNIIKTIITNIFYFKNFNQLLDNPYILNKIFPNHKPYQCQSIFNEYYPISKQNKYNIICLQFHIL